MIKNTMNEMNARLASAQRKMEIHTKIGKGNPTKFDDTTKPRMSVAPTAVPMNIASDSTAMMSATPQNAMTSTNQANGKAT